MLNEESDILVVRLLGGQNIIGYTNITPEGITVLYPLEYLSMPAPGPRGLGEINHIRPYLTMTDSVQVTFDDINVITTYPLSEKFYRSYRQLVDTVYKQSVEYTGSFVEDEGIYEDDYVSPEEEEALNKMIDAVNNIKKTIH